MDLLHPTFRVLYFISSISAILSLRSTILHIFYIQITRIIDKMAPRILIVLTSQDKFLDKNRAPIPDKATGWFLVRRCNHKTPCIKSNIGCSLNSPTPTTC